MVKIFYFKKNQTGIFIPFITATDPVHLILWSLADMFRKCFIYHSLLLGCNINAYFVEVQISAEFVIESIYDLG
jgi:hypothetical protein